MSISAKYLLCPAFNCLLRGSKSNSLPNLLQSLSFNYWLTREAMSV